MLPPEQAVNNFFTPASKKEPEEISWRVVNETLLLARYQPTVADKADKPPSNKRRKIAAFDLVKMFDFIHVLTLIDCLVGFYAY